MRKMTFMALMMAFVLALGFSSCKQEEKQESESAPELKEVDQELDLAGFVGRGGGVHMHLTMKGNVVEGYYYYDKYGNPDHSLKVSGTLDDAGHLDLHETNDEGRPTGHFDGFYGKNYGYKGTFINFNGTASDFELNVLNIKDNAGDGDGRGFYIEYTGSGKVMSGPSGGGSFDDVDSDDSYSDSGSENWDKLLDSYERYVDEYIAMAKKAKNGDPSALEEYTSLMKEAQEYADRLERARRDNNISNAQLARLQRINQKFQKAAQELM